MYDVLFELYVLQKALEYSEKYGTEKVRVLTLSKNRGKGGAVRMVIINTDTEKEQLQKTSDN